MMKKIKKISDKEQIVSLMAKKLADTSAAEELEKNRKKRKRKRYFYWLVYLFPLLIVISGFLFVLKTNNEKAKNIKVISSNDNESPLVQLKKDYNGKIITSNQYAIYLDDILVRYDSLPVKYRVKKTIIEDKQIYTRLAMIWDKVDIQIRNRIVSDLPDLNRRIEKVNDSSGLNNKNE